MVAFRNSDWLTRMKSLYVVRAHTFILEQRICCSLYLRDLDAMENIDTLSLL